MEVHHHSSEIGSHTGKRFKHYLFEFFMLFLAVFCGFLAENWREHIIEHQREIQYIRSFINDLQSDTTEITSNINLKWQKKQQNDSLIKFLNAPDPNQYGQRIYFFARQLTRTFNFIPTDGTMKQLKNSGGLRLIKKKEVVDSILSYDHSIEAILLTQERQNYELNDIRPMMGRLMNPNVLETMIVGDAINPPAGNPHLRTLNKDFILDFIYAVHQIKGSDAVSDARLVRLKEKATGIIQFLKREYHLK